MTTTYRLELEEFRKTMGADRALALRTARQMSAKQKATVYVVVQHDIQDVGQIVYTNGYREYVEGEIK